MVGRPQGFLDLFPTEGLDPAHHPRKKAEFRSKEAPVHLRSPLVLWGELWGEYRMLSSPMLLSCEAGVRKAIPALYERLRTTMLSDVGLHSS